MNKRQQENLIHLHNRLSAVGFNWTEIANLRRIETTLQRWAERECNGEIERDETTNAPYCFYGNYIQANDPRRRHRVPDREAGALRRLNAIMERHPECLAHHQCDPRGCALYIVPRKDVPEGKALDQYYSRGIAVCI